MRFVGERRERIIHVVADELASSLEPETQARRFDCFICAFTLNKEMPRRTRPSYSKVEKKEEGEREDPAALVAARQRVLLLLHALPRELFLAAINAGVTPDSDIDHCCEIPSQLVIDQRERSLARDFFH
ncbi:hypothetical protein TSMEX_001607 [Taenia solium]|eukprot:TsM_001204200 transcript=TsM_001204200 gene=TsM_001204200